MIESHMQVLFIMYSHTRSCSFTHGFVATIRQPVYLIPLLHYQRLQTHKG